MDGLNIHKNFTSIQQIQETYLNNPQHDFEKTAEKSSKFEEILREKTELKFSKHADARLADRNITLTNEQMERLIRGTEKAGEKGIQESLVIMDNLSFIVNTKKHVVVTAMEHSNSNDNIYTNIDGAVIV